MVQSLKYYKFDEISQLIEHSPVRGCLQQRISAIFTSNPTSENSITRNMSSLCITRSISVESQDGLYSPSIDLGKDFEYLIRKCIAEKMARKQQLSDAFGNYQSEPTVGSLDMPLDSENEKEENTNIIEEENRMKEKPSENHISQYKEKVCNEVDIKKLPDELTREENVSEKLNMAGSDAEAVEMESVNTPRGPDEEVKTCKVDNATECEQLFAEFEFPPLVKGKNCVEFP